MASSGEGEGEEEGEEALGVGEEEEGMGERAEEPAEGVTRRVGAGGAMVEAVEEQEEDDKV